MRGIRVVQITNTDRAIRQLILGQLKSLIRAGYEITAISPDGAEVSFIEQSGIKHISVGMNRRFTPIQDLVTLIKLCVQLKKGGFTIVHTHNPKPGLLGQLAARMVGVPIVVNTLHGFYFDDHTPPAWRRFYIFTEKIAARCSDVILSQNREDIETALREGICGLEKIKHLGNGVDLTRFHPPDDAGEARRHKRSRLDIPADAPCVGFVGRLVAEKGLLELFEAASTVLRRMPDVHFLFVGLAERDKPDVLRPEDADKYGIGDVSHFLGLRYDMPELYSIMNVLVLPSHREGFPRALMEASAVGVPCIATDIRGCREAVEPGRNGLLVPLKDPKALADAILEILDNRERSAQMGKEGRRIAQERFDEITVCETIKSEYCRLLIEKGFSDTQRAAGGTFYRRVGKRALDVVLASSALVVLSPVFGAVAVLVRLRHGSPILFRQTRAGLERRSFSILKFRSMTNEQDIAGELLPDADRLTAVGRFLRSSSLDELPELVNVLRGEMSLIGPRPWVPWYLARYTDSQLRRFEVKPGITGWAQVNGRMALSWDRIFELDLWYVDNCSLVLDLKIILKTIVTLIKKEGISQPGFATAGEFTGDALDAGEM